MASQGKETAPPPPYQPPEPAEAFKLYAEEEISRIRETDPDFDPALYDRAVALVMERLGVEDWDEDWDAGQGEAS